MKSSELVSVIIPMYNAFHTVEFTIESESVEYTDYCNTNNDCAQGTTCVSKEVKSTPLQANDVDENTELTFERVSAVRCETVSDGFNSNSCS